jgi:hypothetical protein
LTFMSRIEGLEDSDMSTAKKRRLFNAMFREAFPAYVKREKLLIQEGLAQRNITSFSVSSEWHMEWTESDMAEHNPPMDIEACGIPELRRLLYKLPAQSNFQRYLGHVFKTLARLIDMAELVFEVHVEDQGYAKMRQDLEHQIPLWKAKV